MTAESSTTPADPRRDALIETVRRALGRVDERDEQVIDVLLTLPDTEGVASLRASGTPAETIKPTYLTALQDAAAGLNLKQVATMRRITKSAATMRLARARQRLRAITTAQAVYEAAKRGLLEGVPRP